MNVRVVRCLAVWGVTTTAAAATTWWSVVGVRLTGTFDQLVVGVAGLALAACAAWAWLVTTVVVVQAVRGAVRPVRGVPAWAGRVVLAACGLAVLAAVPAQAADGSAADPPGPGSVDGLPFPDRATGGARPDPPSVLARPAASQHTHVVGRGESLWTIAADGLDDDQASDAQIADAAAVLYARNRPTVGGDPDLIHPGQQLRMPDPRPDR